MYKHIYLSHINIIYKKYEKSGTITMHLRFQLNIHSYMMMIDHLFHEKKNIHHTLNNIKLWDKYMKIIYINDFSKYFNNYSWDKISSFKPLHDGNHRSGNFNRWILLLHHCSHTLAGRVLDYRAAKQYRSKVRLLERYPLGGSKLIACSIKYIKYIN